MPSATATKQAAGTSDSAQALLDHATPADKMDAAAILAELPLIEAPLKILEKLVEDLRARRLDLWCAARLLEHDRPIFDKLADASTRSEALVIKQTKKRFEKLGITPPR